MKVLDINGVSTLWRRIKETFARKDETVKSISRNDTTFTVTRADGTTFEFTQKDTTYGVATESADGLMSSSDKAKLNDVESGAQENVIESVSVNGADVQIVGKGVDIIVPTALSSLVDDVGYLTEESDPTVPRWAKAAEKPTYTAAEVGALADDTVIPSKTSELTNDSGFITGYTETDPTVPAWAKAASKPTYTAAEVGALPSSTVIPTKTSELTNDSGFVTNAGVTSFNGDTGAIIYTAPVTSVNGDTGDVTGLQTTAINDAGDYFSTDTVEDALQQLGGDVDGKQDKAEEVTITTSGAITQALEAGKIYHFTSDALTSLTVTAENPTEGVYEFDFISGETAPTVTMPTEWVMPDNFMVEPSARYRIVVVNGYAVVNRWSDSGNPFTYVDVASGDFIINTSTVTTVDVSNIYANIGHEIIAINFARIKLKNKLNTNDTIKICDVSSKAKALIGKTYVTSTLGIHGKGTVTIAIFDTWNGAEIKVQNSTGANLAAGTELNGVIFILRTM